MTLTLAPPLLAGLFLSGIARLRGQKKLWYTTSRGISMPLCWCSGRIDWCICCEAKGVIIGADLIGGIVLR